MPASTIITIMQDAAHKASRSLIRDFGEVENLQVSMKGPGDFVSAADHRSEKIIMRELSKARPDYGILSEESGEISPAGGGKPEFRWVIDPLDGTTNFLHSVPQFCVSIGLEQFLPNGKSEIIAGVIYAPVLQEIYWAEKGAGAFVGNKRLLVSARKKVSECLISTCGFSRTKKEIGKKDAADALKEISSMGTNVRMFGCATLELAYVAAGKIDGLWHGALKPWDLAAAIAIIREAKGMVSEINGNNNMMKTGSIVATNGHIHDDLRAIVSPFYQS